MTTHDQTTGADARPLGRRLKEDCWDLHQAAERAAVPQHMVRGTMPKDAYADLLGQLLLGHRALDEAIARARPTSEALASLVNDDRQFHAPRLEADLVALGGDPGAVEPREGARALIDRAASAGPLELVGLHYVREGASNGNVFVARKLREAWGMDPQDTAGISHLEPYGDDQRTRWAAFKDRVDALELAAGEQQTVVDAARDMFLIITRIHDDIPVPA